MTVFLDSAACHVSVLLPKGLLYFVGLMRQHCMLESRLDSNKQQQQQQQWKQQQQQQQQQLTIGRSAPRKT